MVGCMKMMKRESDMKISQHVRCLQLPQLEINVNLELLACLLPHVVSALVKWKALVSDVTRFNSFLATPSCHWFLVAAPPSAVKFKVKRHHCRFVYPLCLFISNTTYTCYIAHDIIPTVI